METTISNYEEFKSQILHRAGNLRLKGRDGNAAKGNDSLETFCTYRDLNARTKTISAFIMENLLNFEKLSDDFQINETLIRQKKKLVGNFDFSMEDLDLTGTKAKTLTIFDRSYSLTHNCDILKYLVMYLYEEHEDKLIQMAESNWRTKKRVVLSNNKKTLVSPYEIIKEKIYVETNFSSRDIISYGKDLLKTFDFPVDLVTVYIPE